MPGVTLNIKHDSDKSRKFISELRQRVRMSEKRLTTKHKEWKDAEDKTLAFMPEREVDATRRVAREGGLPQYTTIQIPYSYAVLLSAHTYLTSVFMGRNPIFQFTGRHGEGEQQTQALEALIDYQVLVGEIIPPLYTWLYDVGKYGAGVVGLYWEQRYNTVSQVVEVPATDEMGQPVPGGQTQKRLQGMRVESYAGNCVFNVQPWDFLWDARFPLKLFQKGEYCGLRRTLTWNEIKRREKLGYYMNIDEITTSAAREGGEPSDAGSSALDRPESFDTGSWEEQSQGMDIKHPQLVNFYEIYIELIPKEWGLSEVDWPEKWVFTVTQDFKVLFGCNPLGMLHCKFPYAVLELEAEGYGLVGRGFPKTLEPIQQTIDWLINSHFYNVRAALNNKFVVDPSRIVMKDALDPLPGGIIRLKPEAYGSDTQTAVTQLPIQDVTRTHLADLQLLFGFGERTVGVNDQIMGMLQTGGRKTATEIRTSTTFGVNRLKTIAEFCSCVGFDPLASMMVQNSQQFYAQEKIFKIAGDLVQQAGQQFMKVQPSDIAGFYNFVPVDGTLPIDRYAQANLWKELMAGMTQFPEIALQYDMARIFEWVAKLAGLKNITQFRAQVLPDQELLMMAKLGKSVPMLNKGPPGRGNGARNPNEPRQVANVGPTG